MEDRRQRKREPCYLDANHETTGEPVGNISDIHQEGFKLITKHELSLFEELDISVKTPGRDVCIKLTIKGSGTIT